MECVNELTNAFLCELCLHEESDEDAAEPEFFKSSAALHKWQRKRRKAIKAAAKAFRAARGSRRRRKKR